MKTYTSGEAAVIAGMERATLASWCRSGFVRPSIQTAKGIHQGRGHGHLFSERDVAAISALSCLRNRGAPLGAIARASALLKARIDWPRGDARWLVISDGDVILCGRDDLAKVVRSCAWSMVLDLGSVAIQDLASAP